MAFAHVWVPALLSILIKGQDIRQVHATDAGSSAGKISAKMDWQVGTLQLATTGWAV